MSFAIQALVAEYLVKNHASLKPGLYSVPEEIDNQVAEIKLQCPINYRFVIVGYNFIFLSILCTLVPRINIFQLFLGIPVNAYAQAV